VLINLISNACKFSKVGGIIYLDASVTPVDEEKINIKIDVCDKGIGIHDNDLKKLFKPYFKCGSADSKRLNPNGNGLGLSICKRIVQALGGDLNVSSELEIGSIFSVELTTDMLTAQMAPTRAKPAQKLESFITQEEIKEELTEVEKSYLIDTFTQEEKSLKVLVADDQRINLEAMKMNLKEVGFIEGTEYFVNGQEVIDRVKEIFETRIKSISPVDALLLDFQMPIKNGL